MEKTHDFPSGGRNLNDPSPLLEIDHKKNTETAKTYLSQAEVAGLRVAGASSFNP
tara:strand:- start:846 stop:1010 length:165 start_codon:yes stop_codon:yes gene_type:complete